MASKRYKDKDCAYCGLQGVSESADHVIAREFFFVSDRDNLPQVPACKKCNKEKSDLEHYATATLLAGSKLEDGDIYRREKVAPRLAKNKKLRQELGIDRPPEWIKMRGVIQPLHALMLDADKINSLMAMITKGLYCFHFGVPLIPLFRPDISMFHPKHEPAVWASLAAYFPPECQKVNGNLGRGSFIYEGMRSPAHSAFTIWRMAWHNGIALHGDNTPEQGVSVFWAVTRPILEEAAQATSE